MVPAEDQVVDDASSVDIGEFVSSGDPPSSPEILDFSTGSHSILTDAVPSNSVDGEVVVGEGQSLVHEVSVSASNAVVPDGVSQSGQALSQSSDCSGPSIQVASVEDEMDTSVCRKRKDRSLPELSRALSVDDLLGRSNRKIFKTPAVPPGRQGHLPIAVKERPSALPVRVSLQPVRARDRSPRT